MPLRALEPKSSASANSATFAKVRLRLMCGTGCIIAFRLQRA
jgi:hypothetical protein